MIIETGPGERAYTALTHALRTDPALRQEMWEDGGHEFAEDPDKTWFFKVHNGRPAAWRAVQWIAAERRLKVTDNYHRRSVRHLGFYEEVFRFSHKEIRRLRAVTYLHTGPVVDLHVEHGWQLTGLTGERRHAPDAPPQTWVELTYTPPGR